MDTKDVTDNRIFLKTFKSFLFESVTNYLKISQVEGEKHVSGDDQSMRKFSKYSRGHSKSTFAQK